MKRSHWVHLSRRESQIMDALFRLGRGSVGQIREGMTQPPSYNSVRVLLGVLEEKGYVTHEQDGKRYVYLPAEPVEKAKRSALAHLKNTFFSNSTPQVLSTLLDLSGAELKSSELEELERLIERARQRRDKGPQAPERRES